MKILQTIFTPLKLWITQNIVEILVILVLGYLGFDVMKEFCKECLLIENIEGTAWEIGFKSLVLLLPYIILFKAINLISYFKIKPSNIKTALLNGIVSFLMIFSIGLLKPNDFRDILQPLLATIISSILIILFIKIKAIG